MSQIGSSRFARGTFRSPPSLKNEPSVEPSQPEEMKSEATPHEKKGVAWGKIALGVGSGLSALASMAATPAGLGFIQETHLAQCVGLSDPVDLIDIAVDTRVPDNIPTAQASAQENAQWWSSLSPRQQDELLRTDPMSLGNRAGLPTEVRDRANRSRLKMEKSLLEERVSDLKEEVRQQGDDVPNTLKGKLPAMKLEAAQTRLTDLLRVTTTLENGEDRYLMLLDVEPSQRPLAAVAQGDPDSADHIFVTVPGVNTSVRSLPRMLEEGSAVSELAQARLEQVGRGEESLSTIAWVGYEPPTVEGEFCQKVGGALGSAGKGAAKKGARELTDFFRGLGASHDPSVDPNITAVGHSYGSLTASLALQNGEHPVDNFIVYGSPGLALGNYSDLGLDPGRAFEMTAKDDKVPEYVGKIRRFGKATKNRSDLIHLSTETTRIDGVEYQGVDSHSHYPQMGSNGRLRISGYNVATVVAGLPPGVS